MYLASGVANRAQTETSGDADLSAARQETEKL